MKKLTPLQSDKLSQLMSALRTMQTSNLLAESARLRCPAPADEKTKQQFRNQLAGAFAVHSLSSYRSTLLATNDRREAFSDELVRLYSIYQEAKHQDPGIAMQLKYAAIELQGQQETMFHFLAICGMKFHQLLPLVAAAAGHKMTKSDERVLEGYEHLRHYYEHLNHEFPGKGNSKTSVIERDDGLNWTIQMGLPRDDHGRLLVQQVRAPYTIWTVDVSRNGVNLLVEILDRNLRASRNSALHHVQKHFTSQPWLIPSVDELQHEPLVKMNLWDIG